MSTSANVVEYSIFKDKKHVGHFRQNLMCSSNYSELLKYQPLIEHTIVPFGYDEDEDYWENGEQNLNTFLKKNSLFDSKLRKYFQENK